MKKQTIELLAPAGSWEALEAAVNAGADAVYMGGKAFGARQYASNFDREEMQKAVYFAHMHRVRLYITVNTLVDDSELGELADYLLFLSNVGIDGIIVQDLGVIRLARQIVPDLPLHASTQMTVTNSEGVKLAAEAGMERVVLARELSLEEINTICHGTDTEIEVFIHGALCVCYSGQCLMSSLIGGRSGNRGRCAQPCRLPYKLVNEAGEDLLSGKDAGQYLLSPKDLNTLDILPQLIEAGVTSYKIEGRMKRPEYVAVVIEDQRTLGRAPFSGHTLELLASVHFPDDLAILDIQANDLTGTADHISLVSIDSRRGACLRIGIAPRRAIGHLIHFLPVQGISGKDLLGLILVHSREIQAIAYDHRTGVSLAGIHRFP